MAQSSSESGATCSMSQMQIMLSIDKLMYQINFQKNNDKLGCDNLVWKLHALLVGSSVTEIVIHCSHHLSCHWLKANSYFWGTAQSTDYSLIC